MATISEQLEALKKQRDALVSFVQNAGATTVKSGATFNVAIAALKSLFGNMRAIVYNNSADSIVFDEGLYRGWTTTVFIFIRKDGVVGTSSKQDEGRILWSDNTQTDVVYNSNDGELRFCSNIKTIYQFK